MLVPILVPLFLFSSIFGVVYIFLTTRNKERLALIENGADASLFKSGSAKNFGGVIVINIALLAIGIGVGVLIGNVLENGGMDEDIAYPAMVFICGGLGLLVAYFLDSAFGMEEVAYFSMLLLFGGAGLGLSYIIEEKKASKA